MKKILSLTISALLVMALVAGGTYAFFSDQQVSTGNVFTAGTLDIGLANASTPTSTGNTTATFSTVSTWKPGDTKFGSLYINNNGSLDAGNLTVNFNYSSVDTSLRPTNIIGYPWATPPANDIDNFDKMITATTCTWNGNDVSAISGHTLFDLKGVDIPLITIASLPHNTEHPLNITFTFNPNATNGCQGNSLNVTATVTAYQNTTGINYP